MSLEQRITRLEKELENRAHLPVMVWHEGRRNEALSRYLAEHGREPEAEIKICFVAPKAENQ
jgi:hypothetical protein